MGVEILNWLVDFSGKQYFLNNPTGVPKTQLSEVVHSALSGKLAQSNRLGRWWYLVSAMEGREIFRAECAKIQARRC